MNWEVVLSYAIEPGLEIVTGDSPLVLIDHLNQVMEADPLPPMEQEIIVVQSLGMERWVRQQIALRQGCAASLKTLFPAALCRALASSIHPFEEIDKRFDEDNMTWAIHSLFSDRGFRELPENAPLLRYLKRNEASGHYALARRVSARFAEYGLYRPDMLLDWERRLAPEGDASLANNAHYKWQRALWLRLTNSESPLHFARWFDNTIRLLIQSSQRPHHLPQRISIFGISTLPPLFIRLLQAAAKFVAVRFHVLVPADPASTVVRNSQSHDSLSSLLGRVSREMIGMIENPEVVGLKARTAHIAVASGLSDSQRVDEHRAVGSGRTSLLPASLLSHAQSVLRNPGRETGKMNIAANDRSISVHVCHSPRRELEVLRDYLHDAFASDESLRPHDILVMVPDVDRYAPFVEAVFSHPVSEYALSIPFKIADRSLSSGSPMIHACDRLLSLAGSRLTLSEVIQLLSLEPVHRKIGLDQTRIATLEVQLQNAGVRWGWDGSDRRDQHGVPEFEENSWRRGFDRLLAGYAVGNPGVMVDGLEPAGGDLIGESEELGAFILWGEELNEVLGMLRKDHAMSQWPSVLIEAFSWLLKPEDSEEQRIFNTIFREIDRLRTAWLNRPGQSGDKSMNDTLGVEVIRSSLMASLADERHATAFLSGGMTVCAMKPMRSIPHRVIAMLGLDDNAFPRRERRPAFDLIGAEQRPGDRDLRADDRQLVMDTILCAQDRLHLSYVGRSSRNNSEIPSSVVLTEVVEWLKGITEVSGKECASVLNVVHRLQPFHRDYFEESGNKESHATHFSYDMKLSEALRSACQQPASHKFIQNETDAHIGEGPRTAAVPSAQGELVIELDDLIEAWSNPSRFHARKTLKIDFARDRHEVDDLEPMHVDGLAQFHVRQRMLDEWLSARRLGRRSTDSGNGDAQVASSSFDELPPSAPGLAWMRRLRGEIQPLLHRLEGVTFGNSAAVEVRGGGWRLFGVVDGVCKSATGGSQLEILMVRATADVSPRELVRAWITHLSVIASGFDAVTRAISIDQEYQFGNVRHARSILNTLVRGYATMLERPVAYFINAANKCRNEVAKLSEEAIVNADYDQALNKAMQGFGSPDRTPFQQGSTDLEDPYVALLWRGLEPLKTNATEFLSLVKEFWGPLDESVDALKR